MGKTPILLALGLVVGAVAIVWMRPSTQPAADSTAPELAVDSVLEGENAALAARVADLEEQVSALTFAIDALAERLAQEAERADSQDAASAALMRDIQQRLAVARPDGAPPGQLPDGSSIQLEGFGGNAFVVQQNGQAMRIVGPNAEVLTAEMVAAAAATGEPLLAPQSLTGVQASTGQALVFRVTGSTDGPVWGSDVYTDDSNIGAAAVHAGLLRPGESGTIMVTVQDGFPSYAPSSRNGIDSASYGQWTRSYSMVRIN